MALRVFHCDDHESYRALLRALVDSHHELALVAEAVDGQHAIDTVDDACPDVVLLDVEMPGLDGLDSLLGIRAAVPEAAVFMLSGHDDEGVRYRAFAAGAEDYFVKGKDEQALVERLRTMAAERGCRRRRFDARSPNPFE